MTSSKDLWAWRVRDADRMPKDAFFALISGVVIALVSAWAGAYFASRNAARLEERRWLEEKQKWKLDQRLEAYSGFLQCLRNQRDLGFEASDEQLDAGLKEASSWESLVEVVGSIDARIMGVKAVTAARLLARAVRARDPESQQEGIDRVEAQDALNKAIEAFERVAREELNPDSTATERAS